jgi:hypothetical protein
VCVGGGCASITILRTEGALGLYRGILANTFEGDTQQRDSMDGV